MSNEIAAVCRIQTYVRRFTQRIKYRAIQSLARKRRAFLNTLREIYGEVWEAPKHVPERWHRSMLERLIERNVFDMSDGAPDLSEVTTQNLSGGLGAMGLGLGLRRLPRVPEP